MNLNRKIRILIVLSLMSFTFVDAEEGMWLPNDLPQEIFEQMQARGLELKADEIFNEKGTGVANAVVSLGGGTGSFISSEGLIITNHHVAFGAVQKISSADNNYIEDGFLARQIKDEQPALGYNAFVLLSVKDVTQQILSKLRDKMTPLERYQAIEKESKKIVKRAERDRDVYCSLKDIFDGQKYYLFTYKKIMDIRVVYVPARAIGEFGGDIDNWMWPRHTGDFSFLRAYVAPDGKSAEYAEENVPYNPKTWLRINKDGLKEGDFTMICGFPGSTNRYMTSYGIANQQNFRLPLRIESYQKWTVILEKFANSDTDAKVKLIGTIKSLNNSIKYYQGLIDGFKKFNLLEQKQNLEAGFTAFLEDNESVHGQFDDVLPQIQDVYKDYETFRLKSDVLGLVQRTQFLRIASTLYKWSIEKGKLDLERDPKFMERRIPALKGYMKTTQRTLHAPSDRAVLKMFLQLAVELPEAQRIRGLEKYFDRADLENSIEKMLDNLYGNTRLGEEEARLEMFDMRQKELLKQKDAFIQLAADLFEESEALDEKYDAFEGSVSKLMPRWIEGLQTWKQGLLYPDANGTMRINFGVVKGYSPRDGVQYLPFTSLAGVVEKHTGGEPFNVPQKLIGLSRDKDFGGYVMPELHDVPVDLLTTNDSTGGNSGSPVLNAKGELVAVLFDGNYESMSADYEFNEALTRSIHVDIRYVLFVAEKVDGAVNILEEIEND